jgi:hypothetical protein
MNTAVIIISHSRPSCETYGALRAHGYSGKIFILVDDEDQTVESYKAKYKDCVHVYHKQDYRLVDTCDNSSSLSAAVVARHACHDLAVSLGLDAYVMSDDDITDFVYRQYDENHSLKTYQIHNFDEVFSECYDFLFSIKNTMFSFFPAAMVFPGRFDKFERWCTQFMFRKVSDGIHLKQRFHDDMYEMMTCDRIGYFVFCIHNLIFKSDQCTTTQSVTGGMADAYKSYSPYARRFLNVITNPSMFSIECDAGKGGIIFKKHTPDYVQILREEHKK